MTSKRRTCRRTIVQRREKEVPVRFAPGRDKLEAHTAENPHTCMAGLTLLAQGRVDEALEEARREPEQWARLWALAIIYHVAGRGAEADGRCTN